MMAYILCGCKPFFIRKYLIMNNTNGSNANQMHNKERVIELMYQDCIRGKIKHQIREKFVKQKYDNETCSDRQFYTYWNCMLDKFAEEFEDHKEKLKDKFIARYMYLYEKAVEEKKYKEAREVLDSLKKMTGMDEPIEADININGGFVIDFGLDDIVKDKEDGEQD